jgi:hypothetical protein
VPRRRQKTRQVLVIVDPFIKTRRQRSHGPRLP